MMRSEALVHWSGCWTLTFGSGACSCRAGQVMGIEYFFSWLSEAILCGMLLPLGAGFYHPLFLLLIPDI
jgi:hypothetical protein